MNSCCPSLASSPTDNDFNFPSLAAKFCDTVGLNSAYIFTAAFLFPQAFNFAIAASSLLSNSENSLTLIFAISFVFPYSDMFAVALMNSYTSIMDVREGATGASADAPGRRS